MVLSPLWRFYSRRILEKMNDYSRLLAILCMCAFFSVACGGTKYVTTNVINFRCDSEFNEGMILPVDIVFVPEGESVETITAVSPDEWFDSPVREEWQSRQSISFRTTNTRTNIAVELKKPSKTGALIVIADYRGIDRTEAQQIVLDEEAKENEDIFITNRGLLHR